MRPVPISMPCLSMQTVPIAMQSCLALYAALSGSLCDSVRLCATLCDSVRLCATLCNSTLLAVRHRLTSTASLCSVFCVLFMLSDTVSLCDHSWNGEMGRRRRVYGAAAVLQPVAPVPATQVAPPPSGTPALKAETAPTSNATVKPEGASAASAPPIVPIVIDDDGDAVIDLTGADAAGPSSAAAAVRTSFGTPAGSAGPSYAASSSSGGGASSASGGGGASSASGGGGGGASSSSTSSLFPGLAQLGWTNSLGWGSTTGRPAITPPPWTPPTEAVKGNAGEPPIKRAKTEGEVGAGLDPNGDGDVCIGQFISTLKGNHRCSCCHTRPVPFLCQTPSSPTRPGCAFTGMQYYRGKISNGEMVVLDREPTNPYDSNAIRASNVAHAQVGP